MKKSIKSIIQSLSKKQKTIILSAAAGVLVVVGAVITIVSVAGNAVKNIVVKNSEAPRLIYVAGQDLDLSNGTLTIVKGNKKEESVQLNSSDVTVSGYDKNKVGAQDVVITYDGFETTIRVNVIPRISIVNQKTEYLVSEKFDKSKGTVTVANDDGTTFDVPMSSDKITVEGFTSEAATTSLTLTVTYTDGEVSYQGAYTVSVKVAEEVKINLPTNRIYDSHDTKLDLTGGQIIVKNAGKQSAVAIDETMISGFDPSKATIENRESPLKQTVTISYGGAQKSFEIDVYFSGVSLMKLRASQFGELEYDAEKGTITPDETFGPQAVDAMTEYFALSNEDKALIDTEEKEKVLRHAVAYGLTELAKAATELSDVIVIVDGMFTWKVDGSYSAAKEVYETINDDNSSFVKLGMLLWQIKEEFGKTELVPDALVESNVPEAYSEEELTGARELLDFILGLHDLLSDVEKDWTQDGLTAHSKDIQLVVSRITGGDYSNYGYSPVYQMLSSWREKNDFFDIVYAYYWETNKEFIKSDLFQKIPLPGLLQDLYIGIANGYFAAQTFTQNPTETIWADTVDVFDSYSQVMKLKKEITNETDFRRQLYDYLNLDGFIENNLIFVENGYYTQAKEMYGDDVFEKLWADYLALFELADESGSLNLEDGSTVKAFGDMFKAFVDASPSWQYSFIASIHNRYRGYDKYTKENALALDYSKGTVYSTFVYLYANFFSLQVEYEEDGEIIANEDAQEICEDLFKAIELYALRYKYKTIEDFQETMEDVMYNYQNKLSGAEKIAFDNVLGYCYEKYVALYNKSTSDTSTELGATWTPVFNEMKEALAVFYQLKEIVNSSTQTDETKNAAYPLLFAAYEKAAACAAQIAASEDNNIIYAYYYDEFEINEKMTTSLEYALWDARALFINTMVNGKFEVTNSDGTKKTYRAWDLYETSGVQSFLADAFYVMATQYEGGTFDQAKVLAIMEKYRAVDADVMSMFYSLNCDDLYFAGLENFFATTLTDDNAKALATKLIQAEKAYNAYANDTDDAEKKKAFTDIMESEDGAIATMDKITNEEEYDTYLSAMYQFYFAKYNEVKPTV